MERSKSLAVMFLLGAFVVGGALGFSADRVVNAQRGGHDSSARPYWDRIAAEWKLTPAQRVVVDSLMDDQRRQITALYKPLRPTLDSISTVARSISDSTQAKLRLILTPEQRAKMDAMRQEARRHADQARARRDEEMAKIR